MAVARRYYPEGVHSMTETLVIPQKNSGMGKPGVPPPFQMTEYSYPGSRVSGRDWASTVLLFDPTIEDCLLKTEYYNTGHAGSFWNNNNVGGDTSQRTSMMPSVNDLFIDGREDIRSYPYAYTDAWTAGHDPYGVELPFRSDGLCVQAPSFNGDHLAFSRVPGNAIHVLECEGGQDGNFSPFDGPGFVMFDWVLIKSCRSGVKDSSTDGKWSNIYISGCVQDLFTSGNNTVISNCHFFGGDRGLVATLKVSADQVYVEACRIGTYLPNNAFNSTITGLDIGPGTCWYRGVYVDTAGVTITDISNIVRAEDSNYPDMAGLEVAAGAVDCTFSGNLTVLGTSTGYIMRGFRNNLDVKGGGWTTAADGKLVEVKEHVTGSIYDLRGHINGGVALDLTSSGLNSGSGKGNKFIIKTECNGTAVPIKYPGGGTTYNLADGNEVWINGEQQ